MENLGLGLSLTTVGVGVVFFVLFLLQLFMNGEAWLFKTRRARAEEQPVPQPGTLPPTQAEQTAPEPVAPPPAAAPETSFEVAAPSPEPEGIAMPKLSPQVLAAIAGAIACYTGVPARNFRVVSIRKTTDRQAAAEWTFQGRTDLINTRSSFYAKGGTN